MLDDRAVEVVPAKLKEIDQWITWLKGRLEPDGKFKKFPKGKDGIGDEWQKQHQWMTFNEAADQARKKKHAGIGLVLPALFSNGSHLVALDFDGIDLHSETDNPRLQEIMGLHKRLGCPYVEASPSGKGLRMFVASAYKVAQISCPNPLGGKDELFCASGKWVTITGNTLGGTGIPEATGEIQSIAAKWVTIAKQHNSKAKKQLTSLGEKLLGGMGSLGWPGWPEKKLRDGDGREEKMLAYAGHLRGLDHPQADIERLCLEANDAHYEDRLDGEKVLDRARRYATPEQDPTADTTQLSTPYDTSLLEQIDYTDAGNAALLHTLADDNLKYVHELKAWIAWDGIRWKFDKNNAQAHAQMLKVSDYHKKQAAKFKQDAEASPSPDQSKYLSKAADISSKWALQCRNKNRLDAMLALAQRDPRFLLESNQLDRDPWLLGVENGVVDLQTGILRSASKAEYVLKKSPVSYDPIKKAPRWTRFIDEITSTPGEVKNGMVVAISRPHLAHYLQKALGYGMTGKVNEHLMFIAIGRGANGKNVLLDTFEAIAGQYCETIAPEVLMATKFDGNAEQATPSTRKLAGTRCAISSESKDRQQLDIAVVKRHTGGGSITARGLHENPMTFEITHKLWLITNHNPRVDHMDEATKGRLHMIPFDMKWNRPGEVCPDPTLPNADKGLQDALKTEYEGILAWLVRGAVAYYSEGLSPTTEVVAFTRNYIESQDLMARWLKDECRDCPIEDGLLAGELFLRYESYCYSEFETPQITSTATFGKRLVTLGYKHKKTRLGKCYALRVSSFNEEVAGSDELSEKLDNWVKGDDNLSERSSVTA